MNEGRARKSAPTAAEPPSPDGLATPSSPSVTNEPNLLPPIAADADDLEAIKKAVDDAATVGGGLWLSYLFVLFYLAVAAGSVTHVDLFFENPVKLPFLTGIELPLLAFFFLAPILFIVVHAYTLVHLVMLTEKAKRYHRALHDPVRKVTDTTRENLQWQLPSNIFIQFLSGPSGLRGGLFGWLLRAIAWVTLVIAPILLLLMMQVQFLPFHSLFITWTQRLTLLVDVALIWWLWGRILSGHEVDGSTQDRSEGPAVGLVLSFLIVLFSWTAATFPGEWQEDHWPDGRPFLASDKSGIPIRVSLHDWLFQSPVDDTTRRRRFPFSNTLVLTGFNVLEGLGINDPEKAKWRDYVFRARGRDLKGAILDLASLPKVDFTGAQLQGASLFNARLQGAFFDSAQLQGAMLGGAEIQGASLNFAKLQGALLYGAQLQGASLVSAELIGARLDGAHLQAASLDFAKLQGALLDNAQLQGASLIAADLRGASLNLASLQGASLRDAQLQGARLQEARLQATDLSKTLLWRTNTGPALTGYTPQPVAIRLSDAPETWGPFWKVGGNEIRPWSDEAYQDLRRNIGSLPSGYLRDAALERIGRLACANFASCDPQPPPPEATAWQKSLEDAKIIDAAYEKVLAAVLSAIVCKGQDGGLFYLQPGRIRRLPTDDDDVFVLRGLASRNPGGNARLADAGSEAPELVDFIMSKDCPVSASLTDADKAELLRIKQEATTKPGG